LSEMKWSYLVHCSLRSVASTIRVSILQHVACVTVLTATAAAAAVVWQTDCQRIDGWRVQDTSATLPRVRSYWRWWRTLEPSSSRSSSWHGLRSKYSSIVCITDKITSYLACILGYLTMLH
jgi:hypothetical protein